MWRSPLCGDSDAFTLVAALARTDSELDRAVVTPIPFYKDPNPTRILILCRGPALRVRSENSGWAASARGHTHLTLVVYGQPSFFCSVYSVQTKPLPPQAAKACGVPCSLPPWRASMKPLIAPPAPFDETIDRGSGPTCSLFPRWRPSLSSLMKPSIETVVLHL